MADRQLGHMTKRIRFLIIALSLLVGIPSLTCAGSSSTTDDKIFGDWNGSIEMEDLAVDLKIMPDEADLHFGVPRSCGSHAEHLRTEDRVHTYRLHAKQGGSLQGWCKNLRNGKMVLTQNDDGTLLLNILNPIKDVNETVILEKEK